MTLSGMLLLDVYEKVAESKHVILVRLTHRATENREGLANHHQEDSGGQQCLTETDTLFLG